MTKHTRVSRAVARAFYEAKRGRSSAKSRVMEGYMHAAPSGRGTIFDFTPRELAPGLQVPNNVQRRVGEIRLRKQAGALLARLEKDYQHSSAAFYEKEYQKALKT